MKKHIFAFFIRSSMKKEINRFENLVKIWSCMWNHTFTSAQGKLYNLKIPINAYFDDNSNNPPLGCFLGTSLSFECLKGLAARDFLFLVFHQSRLSHSESSAGLNPMARQRPWDLVLWGLKSRSIRSQGEKSHWLGYCWDVLLKVRSHLIRQGIRFLRVFCLIEICSF